jgi:hypothetical protein
MTPQQTAAATETMIQTSVETPRRPVPAGEGVLSTVVIWHLSFGCRVGLLDVGSAPRIERMPSCTSRETGPGRT